MRALTLLAVLALAPRLAAADDAEPSQNAAANQHFHAGYAG